MADPTPRTRTQSRDGYLTHYKFAVPDADIGPGTQPHVDASCTADELATVHANTLIIHQNSDLLSATGDGLERWGARLGRERKGATPSSGYVTIGAISAGAAIAAGQRLRYAARNLTFEVTVGATYNNGAQVPIRALTTGPGTNVDAGTIIQFQNPPPGIHTNATIYENTDGTGLTGGANEENDEEYKAVLLDRSSNPPASGNAAAKIAAVEDIPGLGVQKAFCYPACLFPGTTGIAFTMRPSVSGASRLPNGAQIAQVEALLKDQFPADDGIIVASGLNQDVVVAIEVTWRTGVTGWADAGPWPEFQSGDPVHVTTGGAGITSSVFRVTTADVYATAPAVGQTIALYDTGTRTFKRKRISAVTVVSANHTWELTFDTSTPGVTDTFIPESGAIVSPWSESLVTVVEPILTYFDRQGPGEQVDPFPDPGQRQRRVPTPTPETYPSRIENRLVDGLFDVVSDAELVKPDPPFSTTVGTPGVLFYLHKLSDLGVFPQ